MSDHKGITVSLTLDRKRKQSKDDIVSFYTQSSLRISCAPLETRMILEMGGLNIFYSSQKDLIQSHATRTQPFHKWYSDDEHLKLLNNNEESFTKFSWLG